MTAGKPLANAWHAQPKSGMSSSTATALRDAAARLDRVKAALDAGKPEGIEGTISTLEIIVAAAREASAREKSIVSDLLKKTTSKITDKDFKAIIDHGFETRFLALFEDSPLKRKKGIMPEALYIAFKTFQAKYSKKSAASAAITATKSTHDSDGIPVEHIEINGTIDFGSRSGSANTSGLKDAHNKAGKVHEQANHIQPIKKAIAAHYALDGAIRIYDARLPDGKKREEDLSFHIIDFKTKSGEHHQIATNDWYGFGTYVIKPPLMIDPADSKAHINIMALLEAGRAWPARYISEEQYLKQILELCDRPAAELKSYIRRGNWRDPNAVTWIKQEMKAEIEQGNKPRSTYTYPVPFGPSAQTTWLRVYHALHSGSVPGLEGITDLDKLHDLVMQENPDLAKTHAPESLTL